MKIRTEMTGVQGVEHWAIYDYGDLRVELPITIDDNDLTSSSVKLTVTPAQIDEDAGQNAMTLEAALDGVGLSADKVVAVQVTGGSANAPDDFADIGTVSVTIPQGQTKGTQTFNFTPADDNIDEGLGETVVLGGTTPGLTVGTATLTIADDDGKGIKLSESMLNVTEGANTSYTVELITQPTATVTVRVSVAGNSDVTVTPASIEFTTGNWNTPQTIRVDAGHDADAAPGAQAQLSHAGSGGGYNGVTALALTVDVADDDSQGITVSKSTITVAEGGQETYTVVLDTEPTGPVTIEPTTEAGSDEDVTVSPPRLTFTPSSWNTAKDRNGVSSPGRRFDGRRGKDHAQRLRSRLWGGRDHSRPGLGDGDRRRHTLNADHAGRVDTNRARRGRHNPDHRDSAARRGTDRAGN